MTIRLTNSNGNRQKKYKSFQEALIIKYESLPVRTLITSATGTTTKTMEPLLEVQQFHTS